MSTGSSRRRAGPSRLGRWRWGVPLATAAAGVLFVASGLSADGTDLRSVTTDTRTLGRRPWRRRSMAAHEQGAAGRAGGRRAGRLASRTPPSRRPVGRPRRCRRPQGCARCAGADCASRSRCVGEGDRGTPDVTRTTSSCTSRDIQPFVNGGGAAGGGSRQPDGATADLHHSDQVRSATRVAGTGCPTPRHT
jgi:hypothetical protein